jgi:hypothetical protein
MIVDRRRNAVPIPHLKANEILGDFQAALLSPPAQRLFATVWNMLTRTGRDSMWFYSHEIARRSRIPVTQLPSAQSELIREKLLLLQPGTLQIQYRLGAAAPAAPVGAEA